MCLLAQAASSPKGYDDVHFLSRFAGVTASAASLNCPYPLVRKAFKKSAIEEYSHCKDYYFPPAQLFTANLGYVGDIEPLASFVAFDQQMLYVAKNDWLAHLFVALFQERTAKFRYGANQLYSRIEEQLGLYGLFDGWRTHISYDEEHSHEDDLDLLFNQEISIPCEQLQCSFGEAALAIDLLICGLSELLILGKLGINPRVSVTSTAICAQHVTGLDCLFGITEYLFQATTAKDLVNEICGLVIRELKNHIILRKFSQFWSYLIFNEIPTLTVECLAQCSTQREIIAVGKIMEDISIYSSDVDKSLAAHKKAVRVFRNHISSMTKSSSEFSFSLLLLTNLAKEGDRIHLTEKKDFDFAKNSIVLSVDTLCDSINLPHYLKLALATISMMEFALSDQVFESQVPQFAMCHNNSFKPGSPSAAT